ncbi:MAG: hypothetical protein ACKVS5_00550 [Parvularculaceae bacterium]
MKTFNTCIFALASVGLTGCGADDRTTSQANETQAEENKDIAAAQDARMPNTDAGIGEGPNDRYVSENQQVVPGSTTFAPTTTTASEATRENPVGVSPSPGVSGRLSDTPSDATEPMQAGEGVTLASIQYKTDADKVAQLTFEQADSNADDAISLEEYTAFARGLSVKSATATPPAAVSVTPSQKPQPNNETGVSTAFENAGGVDGPISRTEFRTAFLERFDMADTDQSDELSDLARLIHPTTWFERRLWREAAI